MRAPYRKDDACKTAGGHCRDHILRALPTRFPRLDITVVSTVGKVFRAGVLPHIASPAASQKKRGVAVTISPWSHSLTPAPATAGQFHMVAVEGVAKVRFSREALRCRDLAITSHGVLRICPAIAP